jgi:phosphatidylserine synthase
MAKNLAMAFMDVPCWFVIVGLVFTVCHGYRGYVLQRWTAQTQKHDQEQKAAKDSTTFVGFAALWLATSVFNALPNIHDIPGGTGALLVFLVVLGLLGVSGILPYVIQLGKLPR